MIYIKDMDMPVDCLACRISCKNEHYLEDGRPFDCPLEEAKDGDLISRTDAIEAVRLETGKLGRGLLGRGDILDIISALPSAEAEPTVIRSKTLMPTKDFKEWAKRVKEVNPNAVVIPCDAEVASAEVAQVVLCKNCQFYSNLYAVCRCPQWDLSRTEYPKVKENDFCSYGEASNED